jgi:hypothetical protein
VGVDPAAVRRMRGASVELDADAILILVVQVPVAAAVPALGLPSCCGQAMGAFHAVNVVPFQR